MNIPIKLPFTTLMMLISFASLNAVLLTPALPDIATSFNITNATAELIIVWYLLGYAFGQLVYGPCTHVFGRKRALYIGISIAIAANLLCLCAGLCHNFLLLVIGRLALGFGSGVGLKMTFTLINENYEPAIASQKTSYLILSFAIAPALATALGGLLTLHFGWASSLWAGEAYATLLLYAVYRLTNQIDRHQHHTFSIRTVMQGYLSQLSNHRLVAGSCMMGGATAFVYGFAAFAPFIAMHQLGMNSGQYGCANLLTSSGMVVGSLSAAFLSSRLVLTDIVRLGMWIVGIGIVCMVVGMVSHASAYYNVFLPMAIINVGLTLILSNVTTLALSSTQDKANGSAVMNFINMSSALLVVFILGYLPLQSVTMPALFAAILLSMAFIFCFNFSSRSQVNTPRYRSVLKRLFAPHIK